MRSRKGESPVNAGSTHRNENVVPEYFSLRRKRDMWSEQ